MKLLIVTQAVDARDSNLGFFLRWIEAFSSEVEHVHVICLREGVHSLSSRIRVHSLGKEKQAVASIVYALRFLRLTWRLRKEYDTVFVHMNPEYIAIAGLLWRLLKKRVGLWYTHKSRNTKLYAAVFFSDMVFTASKGSFPFPTNKLKVMGHGIDTEFFSPDPSIEKTNILSVGRLMRSKHHDLAIRAVALARKELLVIGDGPDQTRLETLAQDIQADVHFLGGLSQQELRDEYRKAKFLVHSSDTGGLDKVVLEALATDVAVITTNPDMFTELPVQSVPPTPEAVAQAFSGVRESIDRVSIVRKQHSLKRLIPSLVEALSA